MPLGVSYPFSGEMMSYRPIAACAAIVVIMLAGARAQGPVTGVFFNEGWESGNASSSFNSNVYGRATGGQFSVQTAVTAQGQYALRHALTAGTHSPPFSTRRNTSATP